MADSLHCLGIDTSSSALFHHHSRNPSVVPVDKLDPITHQHVVKAADALEQEFEGLYTRAVIDPVVAEGLLELGLDLAEAYSKPLTADVLTSADSRPMGRSVGDVDIPQETRHEDWRVGDPNGADLDEVRRIRDDIDRRVQHLLDELDG